MVLRSSGSSTPTRFPAGDTGNVGDGLRLDYERLVVRPLLLPWARDLVGRAQPRAGQHVADLACATGSVARTVAPLVGPSGHVHAFDPSATMLATARYLPPPPGAQAPGRSNGS